jgi:exopolysaccharide biosynthesis polyprenyl glycosylphosphotransferase
MVYNRYKGFKKFYYLTLIFVLIICFWLWLAVTMAMFHSSDPFDWEHYLFYQLTAALGLLWASINSHKLNDAIDRSDPLASHIVALRNAAYVGGAILLVMVLLRDAGISRLFLFSFLPLLYVAFLVAHLTLPKLLVRTLFSDRHERRVLLVGSAVKVREMKRWCRQTAELGLDVANLLEDSDQFLGASNLPESVDLERLERTIRHEKIQQIILLELPPEQSNLEKIVALSDRLGIRLLVVNNLPEIFKRPISYFSLYGVEFIGVREEPLEEPMNRLIKRGLDLAISIPVVVFVLPPLMLLVAILHRLQSPGPLFYRQTRAGFSRERFRILKFRTMHTKVRSGKQATSNDSRVFTAGRWLRRTSLDEFPQFINVLRGEMSVVGPRPHMLIHDRKFCAALQTYLVRSFVKPGITGLAQVRGFRGEVTSPEAISERVKYDAFYLEFWSIWRDVQILFETIKQIFYPPSSAY